MRTGEVMTGTDVWTLPSGFRIYGFHGAFYRSILFLGPVFKAMELNQWDQSLYRELPKKFKMAFQMMVLMKHRHQHLANPPPFDFWQLPEAVWDRIVHMLLYETYYDMDENVFFKGIDKFYA